MKDNMQMKLKKRETSVDTSQELTPISPIENALAVHNLLYVQAQKALHDKFSVFSLPDEEDLIEVFEGLIAPTLHDSLNPKEIDEFALKLSQKYSDQLQSDKCYHSTIVQEHLRHYLGDAVVHHNHRKFTFSEGWPRIYLTHYDFATHSSSKDHLPDTDSGSLELVIKTGKVSIDYLSSSKAIFDIKDGWFGKSKYHKKSKLYFPQPEIGYINFEGCVSCEFLTPYYEVFQELKGMVPGGNSVTWQQSTGKDVTEYKK